MAHWLGVLAQLAAGKISDEQHQIYIWIFLTDGYTITDTLTVLRIGLISLDFIRRTVYRFFSGARIVFLKKNLAIARKSFVYEVFYTPIKISEEKCVSKR